jgi:acetyl esterase/lipase
MRVWLLAAFAGALVAGIAVRAAVVGRAEPAAVVAASAPHERADDAPADVAFERDIVYGQAGDETLKLNLALPAGATGRLPAIVVIHGGAWRAGSRSQLDDLTWTLARAGFVAATVSYRFCPTHHFPAQVHDVQRAVRFLRANAERYHVDPDHIGAVGFSAGAHLAMLLGTLDPADGLDEAADLARFSAKVQAVVSFFGPTDLELPATDETRPLLEDFIGGPLDSQRASYHAASPVTYVNAGDAPMLLFQGTDDPLVPSVHATRMADVLQQAGVAGRVELIVGAGHGDWTAGEFARTSAAMLAFFQERLGGQR